RKNAPSVPGPAGWGCSCARCHKRTDKCRNTDLPPCPWQPDRKTWAGSATATPTQVSEKLLDLGSELLARVPFQSGPTPKESELGSRIVLFYQMKSASLKLLLRRLTFEHNAQ